MTSLLKVYFFIVVQKQELEPMTSGYVFKYLFEFFFMRPCIVKINNFGVKMSVNESYSDPASQLRDWTKCCFFLFKWVIAPHIC